MDDIIVQQIHEEIFLNIIHRNIDLFLCGGASNNKHKSNRDELRNRLEKNPRISIFYPEDMFMELLSRKKYDLLTMESFLADNSDLILIVCESPGSFAELGAFAHNDKTFNKVVVLLQTKFKNAKSFITQGPVQYIKSKNKNNVIYFNNNLDDMEKQVNKLLNARLGSYRYRRSRLRKKPINLISGQYCFIILLLYFYKNIGVKEIVDAVRKIYNSKKYDEKKFEMVFNAAIRRMYKEGVLNKTTDTRDGKNYYELTYKGYNYAKKLLGEAMLEDRDKAINKIRLQLIRNQYY